MRNSVLSPLPALLLVSLLHAPSNVANAENPSALSLEIRCTEKVLKAGDEIPIEFTIKNNGTEDYNYRNLHYNRLGPIGEEYRLTAKTASGESVPDPVKDFKTQIWEGSFKMDVLHPGWSFSKVVPLNSWALIKEPGRYEVTGSYLPEQVNGTKIAPANSAPITLTILPRTKEDMRDYIQGLSNQIEVQLVIQAGNNGVPLDWVLSDLLPKLAYTYSPEVVPVLLRALSVVGNEAGGNEGLLVRQALLYYLPRTPETRQAILQAAIRQGLNWSMYSLLHDYGFNNAELKPLTERALGPLNPGEWVIGAEMAIHLCYDDAFTAPLIAIALNSNAPVSARGAAAEALAWNRTDAGVKALKILLNDPDPQIGARLAQGLQNGCALQVKTPSGRHLLPGDFTAEDVRPLTERLLASTDNASAGVRLARMFPDDTLTPKLVALAKNPRFSYTGAVYALALNRTDEGVRALKALLNGPDETLPKWAEDAIRHAYTSRGDEPGRPLRPDDFDAKFQQPEATPPK